MAASRRYEVHAWFTYHAPTCPWRQGRSEEPRVGCVCGADPQEIVAKFDAPHPNDDIEGYVRNAHRAVINSALEMAKGTE
jgi:flagellar basal body rod protein FlgC